MTLSSHMMLSDTEIYTRCTIRLIYLGLTTYGIIRDIKHPSPSVVSPTIKLTAEQKSSTTQKRGRKTTCRKSKQITESKRENLAVPVKKTRTLSENRNLRYGITDSSLTTTTETGRRRRSCRRDIDYLSLNDGLEGATPETPKQNTRTSYPPNRKGPTPRRVAAQCISSPEKSPEATTVGKRNEASALKGIPPNIVTGTVISPEPSTLTGIQNLPANPLATLSLPGVPSIPQTATELIAPDLNTESLPYLVVDDTTANVQVAPDTASTSQAKATETFNVEPLSMDNEAEMDVVDALLSLSNVQDNVEDPTLEN